MAAYGATVERVRPVSITHKGEAFSTGVMMTTTTIHLGQFWSILAIWSYFFIFSVFTTIFQGTTFIVVIHTTPIGVV